MALSPASEVIPFEPDAQGVMRVGKTRVSLDTLVGAFSEGATAEEIVQQYPSLRLADVYSVLGYYLRHAPEFEDYLHRRREHRTAVRHKNEVQFDPQGIRERLLARHTANTH